MACEFKQHDTLVAEDVTILFSYGQEIDVEVIAETPEGYFARVPDEDGQEYWFPKSTIVLVKARSRKLRGTTE